MVRNLFAAIPTPKRIGEVPILPLYMGKLSAFQPIQGRKYFNQSNQA
jgi:hypothetical protein